jgi:23S rRNA (cytosine1962-C5)-methyltransferase
LTVSKKLSIPQALNVQINIALEARSESLDAEHVSSLRLFNGFYEGYPGLVVDVFARTLVLLDHRDSPQYQREELEGLQNYLLECYPWIDCVVKKTRLTSRPNLCKGVITFGKIPARKISEHGVWYALDLQLNQGTSFYLDTRNLRKWLLDHAAGWEVINFFAYTGSLGVAALAGGGLNVIQVDRNAKFLALADRSAKLNRFDLARMALQKADFFSRVAYYKRTGKLFDCVILDPPYFSTTTKGTINQVDQTVRVINKVRPLLKDDGWLVAINNALFLSGQDYIQAIETLCADGYLTIEDLIPVPNNVTGFPQTIIGHPPSNPSPFNHPTKIVILRVRRKPE